MVWPVPGIGVLCSSETAIADNDVRGSDVGFTTLPSRPFAAGFGSLNSPALKSHHR